MSKNGYSGLTIILMLALANACGGGRRSTVIDTAEHADRAIADAVSNAKPGLLARITVTKGSKTTIDNGKVSAVNFWTCECDMASEVEICRGAIKGEPNCKNTPRGSACID